ncbi:hypothetical protein EVAR_3634_1 [Eumeta japonica]|uniref:Uncharacterized protein n=1 Tax=Eumeta variegata TaxID=151549 RepID=A0A4C1SZ80_EUMVA|nr:hypothetical protein EVAR_3634_1 [Eumeta japonica]
MYAKGPKAVLFTIELTLTYLLVSLVKEVMSAGGKEAGSGSAESEHCVIRRQFRAAEFCALYYIGFRPVNESSDGLLILHRPTFPSISTIPPPAAYSPVNQMSSTNSRVWQRTVNSSGEYPWAVVSTYSL